MHLFCSLNCYEYTGQVSDANFNVHRYLIQQKFFYVYLLEPFILCMLHRCSLFSLSLLNLIFLHNACHSYINGKAHIVD